ncbi:DUF732 domain-containing protein [Mycobacterium sp.]|uniref:DUF732 domain-containing protein n=1 Tax=Mycobacterium sp. TaxID=1785 RepID=UPI0031E3E505
MSALNNRCHRVSRVVAGATCAIAVGAASATPARADAIDDSFLSALSSAGIDSSDPGSMVSMGQSICPMLAQPTETFASAASSVVGGGISPMVADMFTSIAVSTYCPELMSSIADGQMPSMPGIPGMPGMPGLPTGL